jgi:ABC-type multidrug transport system permease subunit
VTALHEKLLNPEASTDCKICSISSTDQFFAALNMYYSDHWRNVGIMVAYVGFNVAAAVFLYWLFRVPKH